MRLFVKPKEGQIIRDPRTHLPIPPEGKDVPGTSFWIRRLNGGDVELANKKKAEKPKPKPDRAPTQEPAV